MKYILVFQLFLSGLFAHGSADTHAHFFSSLHLDGLVVFIVTLVVGLSLYRYQKGKS